jgi:hypothetical protein
MPYEAEGNFAFGDYGDYGGVAFYGPPDTGCWTDKIEISNRFIRPLFNAIVDRVQQRRAPVRLQVPRLISQWNQCIGWTDPGPNPIVPVSAEDAREVIDALAEVSEDDVRTRAQGASTSDCLRCAAFIARFLGKRLSRRSPVFIELV